MAYVLGLAVDFLRSATINLGSEDSLLWLFVWLSKQCGITGADPQSRAVCAKDLMSTLCTFGGVYFGWALVKPSNGWSSSSNFMYKKPSPLAPRPHGGVNCSLVSVMIRKNHLRRTLTVHPSQKASVGAPDVNQHNRRNFIYLVRITFGYCHIRQFLKDPHPSASIFSEVSTVCRA